MQLRLRWLFWNSCICLLCSPVQGTRGLPKLLQLNTTREADQKIDAWSQNGRWFFSALLDTERNLVDILADLPQDEALSVGACRFTSSFVNFPIETPVQAFRMLEWDTTDCYRFRCTLIDDEVFRHGTLHVSLIFANSTLHLPPRPVEFMLPHAGHLAACIGPLFSSRPYFELKNYLQYYADLGIEHFYIYVHGYDHESALLPDISLPRVTWVQYKASPKRFYSGQVPMMQDCHSRLRNAFDYLAYFDVDEFLVLKTNTTLMQYLHDVMPMQQPGARQISALTFSTWEYPAYCDQGSRVVSLIDPAGKGSLSRPVWQVLKWGKSECVGHNSRTKNIVRAQYIEERSPHDVTKFVVGDHHHLLVPCAHAHVRHYRESSEQFVKCSELLLMQAVSG